MKIIQKTLIIILCSLIPLACSVTKDGGDTGEVHYILGTSYLREGNPTLALKEFLIALDFEDSSRIHACLGQAYQLKKAYNKAEEHYKVALRRDTDNPQFANNLGALYLDMERWDGAIKHFRQAADNLLFTSPEIALTGLGFAYYRKGDYLQAIKQLQNAASIAPRYALANYHLGETYFALNKTDLAIRELQRAIELSPGFAAAHYKLALTHMKRKNKISAITEFKHVLSLAPDSKIGRLSKDYLKLLK